MEHKKKYFKYIDIIRIFSCTLILLFHLGILKGGFFLVNTFFVISAYLSTISLFAKDKTSFKDYYLKRLKNVYLPLVCIVFITIFVLSLFPNISLISLKNETTSILLSYNNYWQLSANLDYFARHIDSPFIHLWYISILLQFEIVFPFLFAFLKKTGEKTKKIIPVLISVILAVLSICYFIKLNIDGNTMASYYNTFARCFSLMIGVALGFIHNYYGSFIPDKFRNIKYSSLIFYSYLLLLLIISIFIDASSKYYAFTMIFVSIISIRVIDYATLHKNSYESIKDKGLKILSSLTYEIYLVQYPIIYFAQYYALEKHVKIAIIIGLTLVLSFIIHYALNFKKSKLNFIKNIIRSTLLAVSLYGGFLYVTSEDHTEEMRALEELLNQNQNLMNQRQEEYLINKQKEEEEWAKILSDLDNSEEKINEMVKNASVVGIGDSVMLGAVANLYEAFPNGYFDAKVSRTAWSADDILSDLINKNMLGDIVILHLGTNGDCSLSCKETIMQMLDGKRVYWVTVTNDYNVYFNDKIKEFTSNYPNSSVIDWEAYSAGKSDYFYSDGIHLTIEGRRAYVNMINDELYKYYLEEYNKKKEEIIASHEENQKNKVTFYGNDLLLNSFNYMSDNLKTSKLNIDKDYNYESLKKDLLNAIENDELNYKVVLAFDSTNILTKEEVNEIKEILKDYELYIVTMSKQTSSLYDDNVNVIDFYSIIKENDNYLLVDQIHLSEEGNKALSELIEKTLNIGVNID